MTSPQPRGIIIPIVSENLPFKMTRKALPMPSGQNEGTTNFPYQILLVSFTCNIGMNNLEIIFSLLRNV